MSVTERHEANGEWSVRLAHNTPGPIRDRLRPEVSSRGHIVITPTAINLGSLPDAAALAMSRYTGIYIGRDDETLELSGIGVNAHLGDGSGRGRSVGSFGTPAIGAGTFAQWRNALIPSFLGAGVTSSIAGTFVKTFTRTFYREIIQEVGTRFGADWRVTNDFKLDFGLAADLFRSTPQALVVRHSEDAGRDLNILGVHGDLGIKRDTEDWARRLLYFYGDATVPVSQTGGVADHDVPFRAPDGSPAYVDMIIEDSTTQSVGDATSLSAAQFARITGVRHEMTLRSVEYDIGRDVAVGDPLYVYDLERGIYDLSNPVIYRGQTIFPDVIRCVGYTWPIRQGMGVWFRRFVKGLSTWSVEWTDLTPYVVWEDGDNTTVEVGAKPRKL